MYGYTAKDTLTKAGNRLIAILQSRTNESAKRTAVFLIDNHVMAYVHQTTSQITCVSRLHSGISQTLTGTVSRNEVLQHRHSFLEVRKNRVLNRTTSLSTCLLRLGHQTTHTSQLSNLVLRSTGTRVKHHVNSVEALVCLGHLLHQHITQTVVHVSPGINHLIVTLIIRDEAHVIVIGNLLYLVITLLDKISFLIRNDNIIEVERQTCQISHAVTEVLDTIEELTSLSEAHLIDYISNDVAE